MQNKKEVTNVLVFCKASLKYQWLRDGVNKFTDDNGIVIDGTKKKRESQYEEAKDEQYQYVFVNYELLLHDFEKLKEIIVEKDIKLIIADEAHKLANPKGKMNNLLQDLVQPNKDYKGVEYLFFLTATPLASKVEQTYGLFSIRRPDTFGSFTQFAKDHLTYTFNGRHSELVGYKKLDEIREKTWKFILRRTSKEVSMELPEVVEIFQDVQFTKLQKNLDAMAKAEMEELQDLLSTIDKENTSPQELEALEGTAKSMFYVRKAIANHPGMLLRSKSDSILKKYGTIIKSHKERDKSPKMDELLDLVDQLVIENEEKIIIFSEYETMIQIIKEELNKKGISSQEYTGKLSSEQKDKAIQRFHTDDCNVILATEAMTEGVNAQVASAIIMVDLPWNPNSYVQRVGRIQRGGSKHKTVKVINLFAREGIDPAVWDAIQNKQNLFDYLIENTDEQSEALRKVVKGL